MTATEPVAGTEKIPGMVTLTIDDAEVTVPEGTLVIRAAELVGVEIPRFCDHPLLAPAGACRQCLVEIEGQRKPMASCTIPVSDGMVVRTQRTSETAESAQRGVMELLLINHPLDCPTCDKGGECPLQNQAMSTGRPVSRFGGTKRTFTKPVPLSSEVLLDRERCVLCARCTRFSNEIAGDPLIELAERGALQQVSAYQDEPFESYFSGNTVQICPVGALTGAAYRFRARPFDLVSSPSVCEHCAGGCALRTDHRSGTVLRRLAGDDPEVNEEWNCDKGRWAFAYPTQPDRLTHPLVRDDDGTLREASWPQALAVAAAGLAAAGTATGVLVGGRATVEDAYAYAKFARAVCGSNDVDFRARAHSAEEAEFLAAHVAGTGITLTYADIERAPAVVLAGLEPEDESPALFLRLRKAVRRHGLRVLTLAPWRSPGSVKTDAALLACRPGDEAAALADPRVSELLAQPGAVLLAGERLATSPGALRAAAAVASATGARLGWVPRRAGERGALDVGAAPGLLPAGRPVSAPEARREVAHVWGTSPPAEPGRDTAAILGALGSGALRAVVIGGVDLDDLPDPAAARAALARRERGAGGSHGAPFVVSLELRRSTVTEYADVVFPVAATAEKPGTFVDWEGRPRPFATALPAPSRGTLPLPDHRVLHALAAALGTDLNCDDTASIHREFQRLGPYRGERTPMAPPANADGPLSAPDPSAGPVPGAADSGTGQTGPGPDPADPGPGQSVPGPGRALLASWRMLIDSGRMQDGEPHLAGTARPVVARLSAATAASIGAADGAPVTVSTERGAITAPLAVTDMPDGVVWLPMNSPGSHVHTALGVAPGAPVQIAPAQVAPDRITPVQIAPSGIGAAPGTAAEPEGGDDA